jgi:hypothetical protein
MGHLCPLYTHIYSSSCNVQPKTDIGMVYVMPNKCFSKNTNQLCSVWKMVWITGNMTPCSILKKLNIIWNLMILKEHLIYNKSDRNIISTMSSDVVTDAFSTRDQ